jgi:hypothetical protein
MQLMPIGNYVLCTKEQEANETVLSNTIFTYNDEVLPIYKIINVPLNLNDEYSIGDLIVTNSIPTVAEFCYSKRTK